MSGNKVANLTITGKIGPGNSVTSLVLNNVQSIDFQIANDTIAVRVANERVLTFDYDATATVTYTISSGTATITIS